MLEFKQVVAKSVFALAVTMSLVGSSISVAAANPASVPVESASEVRLAEQIDVARALSAQELPKVDDATINAAFADLMASDAPRIETVVDGQRLVTFTLPTGTTMTFAQPEFQVMLGGGWGKWGLYVDFNRTDQTILLSGGGAALAAALCFIPGVGVPLCVVAAAVVAAATAAVIASGLCNNTLRIWVSQLGYPECV